MKVGIFMEETRRGLSQAEAFPEALRLAESAEAWGLDGVWLGEMHFNPPRSVLSAPLVFAAAIAARTRRLRVGTAVQLLPLSNPLRLAEEVATVDHISRGRFDFGIGRSGSPRAYDGYGIPYAESQARFQEALDIMRLAWKGEPFGYRGAFHRFEGVTVSPRPYQLPHPPLRMAATSDETFRLVARLGLPIFAGLRGMDIPELRAHLRTYRGVWRAAGHAGEPSVYLRIPVYAAPTEHAALEEARASITYYFQRQAEFTRAAAPPGTGPDERREALAERLENLSYADILKTRVVFGSPAGLVDRLTELQEQLGLDGIVAELNPGGLISAELETQSLYILAHEVLPALRQL
jgi:alkanesulfonate monooxygenase SsuD/methylene tetrahydromethanopterin reductase-like flavin-dependent oxidoreductase (luciferase family)